MRKLLRQVQIGRMADAALAAILLLVISGVALGQKPQPAPKAPGAVPVP